jgi:hypothetical protein
MTCLARAAVLCRGHVERAVLIQVALVSEQTLANLLPALHEPRPDRVVLVASDEMARRQLHLRQQRLMRHFGIDVQIESGAPDADLERIRDFALELLGRLQVVYPGAELVLNATGGNKLMMLGFIEAFRGDARIVYADTQHGRIEALRTEGGAAQPPLPMCDVLDVPGYLRAQGFVYEAARSDRPDELRDVHSRKAAAKHLGAHAAQLGSFIGALNRASAKALDERSEVLVAPRQEFEHLSSPLWRDALVVLNRSGALKWFGGEDFEFPDAGAARFCGGGWLEEYVWHIVRDAHPYDKRWSVTGHWEQGARNEFDVLAVHRNRLLFIECKTLRLGRAEDSDSDVLYKVDSLGRSARGLFGETWLVLAREPAPQVMERADTQRIRPIGPAELVHLRTEVIDWMKRAG